MSLPIRRDKFSRQRGLQHSQLIYYTRVIIQRLDSLETCFTNSEFSRPFFELIYLQMEVAEIKATAKKRRTLNLMMDLLFLQTRQFQLNRCVVDSKVLLQ